VIDNSYECYNPNPTCLLTVRPNINSKKLTSVVDRGGYRLKVISSDSLKFGEIINKIERNQNFDI